MKHGNIHRFATALTILATFLILPLSNSDFFASDFGGDKPAPNTAERLTKVAIEGLEFTINGHPTYEGRTWNSLKIEGLLLNARLVQGIFDDLNPDTRSSWNYPDTGEWDPERNTCEFIEAMSSWRCHGLLAFTINLQGGSPQGYSKEQPWHNSAITSTGELRPDYMNRLEGILDRADQMGMVVIVGIFYFGQDQRLEDESAIIRAVDNTLDWLFDRNYQNVLIEVDNECNVRRYDHSILKPDQVHELILRVKNYTRDGRRFLVGTSYGGGHLPDSNVVSVSDFILLHGNGVDNPQQIVDMVKKTRMVPGYHPMPILFNEDDHYDFNKPFSNMVAAISQYASWGYFDFRREGEDFGDGFQSVPVDWTINSKRKRNFFTKVREVTGVGLPVTAPDANVHKLAAGFQFTEGPAADATGDVFFTDIPNNRIHVYSIYHELSTVRENTGGANGLFFDKEGNLLVCEGGNRQLTSIDNQGEVTVLADQFNNKKLNSPNDLWIDPKGGVYFSDPRYGDRDGLEQEGEHVYFLTPDRNLLRVIDDMVRPNGLIGTPDGRLLYVADAGDEKVFVYTIQDDGTLVDKKLFVERSSDGMTIDNFGNIYVTSGAVLVYDPWGNEIEKIEVPERPSNVCFGGQDRQTLFITARTSFYAIKMRVKGVY